MYVEDDEDAIAERLEAFLKPTPRPLVNWEAVGEVILVACVSLVILWSLHQ